MATSHKNIETGIGLVPNATTKNQVKGDLETLTTDDKLHFFGASNDAVVTETIVQTLTNKTLTSPTLTTPNIGAASGTTLSLSGQLTSTVTTGTAPFIISSTTRVTNLNADTAGNSDTVTTNANLTGPITSVGNTTSVASQTGTGSTFVMQNSPTLTTPNIGDASGTTLSLSGQFTSTVSTGTAPFIISSTTKVANLYAATAGNADTVTTNANMTGDVTSVGNTTTISNLSVTNAKIANATIDLTTKVTGALPIANGGTGQTTSTAAFDALSPMTTGGDLIYGGTSGTGTRLPNGSAGQILQSNGGTSAPTWVNSTVTPVVPTIQRFLSGSGTYTTPSSPAPLYIKVTVVGGGGGGSSQGGGVGTVGTASSFGTSLLTANGGSAANTYYLGNVGGSVTISAPAVKIVGVTGGGGGSGGGAGMCAGVGGSSILGGGGAGGALSENGAPGEANTGGGGGGGGNAGAATGGGGGGAGGGIVALISSPGATYSYVVGPGGTGGVATRTGGDGGTGQIIVEEFYQ